MKVLVSTTCFLSKYLLRYIRSRSWGISANVNNIFGLFVTHSYTNSTKNAKKEAITFCRRIRIVVGVEPAAYPITNCSYLDIYISRKTRLCVVDLEGKYQTNIQAKLINFLVWKFRSIILNFLRFFAGFVKSSAFYTLLLLFQRVDMFEL